MPLLVNTPEEHIKELQINRAEARGALTQELIQKIEDTLDELFQYVPPRAIIISSVGPVFSAGADLKERKGMDQAAVKKWLNNLHRLMDKIEDCPVPVICSLQGPALGGGMELSLACDFRICTKNTFFQLPEVTLGIIPGGGGTIRLPQLLGKSLALEMILFNKKLTSEEALQKNFVLEVCESETALRETTLKAARHLASLPPLAVRAAKNAIHGGHYQNRKTRTKFEIAQYEPCLKSEDRVEALKAFLEKRPPKFKGY